ncbi:MAG: DUF1444 family protein [Pirellulales bacterium]|nr:DUF1444 family protein [Pirellulales bacterium]
MNRIIRLISAFSALLGFCGCHEQRADMNGKSENSSPILSPSDFTSAYASKMTSEAPKLKVIIKAPLQLRVINAHEKESTAFLDNAYREYKLDQSNLTGLLERYVKASLETARDSDKEITSSRIVPIIKDRNYLEETKKALAEKGFAMEDFDQVYGLYNDELVILYAEDTTNNIRYLTKKAFESLKLEMPELRAFAVKNLKNLLPKIELHGSNGTYMMTAGGTYEASLLLFDSIWQSGQVKVDGDIIVAIPSRDLLLITGSKNEEGLEKLQQAACETVKNGAYQLTTQLFVYKNGTFVPFKK